MHHLCRTLTDTVSPRLFPACQALVRFFALRRIKQHAPPLVRAHREFHSPLPASSLPVSTASPGLSPGFSQRTQQTAYELFTPNNSGQRLRPTYYRGCWHVVSRRFFCRYRHFRFVPAERGLQPEGLHPPRGVAASGFRPLRNIPHCCLP